MKKYLAVLALLAAPVAQASDVSLSVFMTGFSVPGNGPASRLDLDLTIHNRYFGVNGSIEFANSLDSPVTGTCFVTNAGGVYCNLQLDQFSINLDIDPNLQGSVEAKDSDGFITSQAGVTVQVLN